MDCEVIYLLCNMQGKFEGSELLLRLVVPAILRINLLVEGVHETRTKPQLPIIPLRHVEEERLGLEFPAMV
jgi:hypothetical protein